MGIHAKEPVGGNQTSMIQRRATGPRRIFGRLLRYDGRPRLIQAIRTLLIMSAALTADSQILPAAGPQAKLSNPVGFISVPFQNNFEGGIKPNHGFKWTLNLQPILPFALNRDWNLINRISLPVIHQGNVFGGTAQTGIGDAVLNVLFSPKSGRFIWGAGPVFYFPIGSSEYLTLKKWGAGPTALAIVRSGRLTAGILYFHAWSFAGGSGRPGFSFSYAQPFLNRALSKGWGVGITSEIINETRSRTTNGTVIFTGSKLARAAGFWINCIAGPRLYFGNFNKPAWGARAAVALLFPGR
jgi:hypothetical protein